MDDKTFLEMAAAYQAQYSVDKPFAAAKMDRSTILRAHEYIERRKTRMALERIAKLLEKRK